MIYLALYVDDTAIMCRFKSLHILIGKILDLPTGLLHLVQKEAHKSQCNKKCRHKGSLPNINFSINGDDVPWVTNNKY